LRLVLFVIVCSVQYGNSLDLKLALWSRKPGPLQWICARDQPLVPQAQTIQRAAINYPGNVIQCEARHIEDCALRVWVMKLK
jgi:hypothetical protein